MAASHYQPGYLGVLLLIQGVEGLFCDLAHHTVHFLGFRVVNFVGQLAWQLAGGSVGQGLGQIRCGFFERCDVCGRAFEAGVGVVVDEERRCSLRFWAGFAVLGPDGLCRRRYLALKAALEVVPPGRMVAAVWALLYLQRERRRSLRYGGVR